MDLIDLEDDHIDAEVLSSLAVTMENFKVSFVLASAIFTLAARRFLIELYLTEHYLCYSTR